MKRVVSFIFIGLVFLNIMGYYGLLVSLEYQNARYMTEQLDLGNYDEAEASTLKIPFPAPDENYSGSFERIDGDFVRDGEVYRLVKQRFYRDTFHIVYIQDKTGTVIRSMMTSYVKTFTDTGPEDGKQTYQLPIFIKEYYSPPFSLESVSPGWQYPVRKESHETFFVNSFCTSIVHPPERTSFSS